MFRFPWPAYLEDEEKKIRWILTLQYNVRLMLKYSAHCVKHRNFTLFSGLEVLPTSFGPFAYDFLWLSAKFPHQEIRWNFGILHNERLCIFVWFYPILFMLTFRFALFYLFGLKLYPFFKFIELFQCII